jgi:hypothetical protein
LQQCFFGEHLLLVNPNKPVAVIEAEKTAVIASMCYPQFIWLATGSKQNLKAEKLRCYDDRKIMLYPDADGFEQWSETALDARGLGVTVSVSDLIENHATDEQRANGYDLADYLIEEQLQINGYNSFIDSYNSAVDSIVQDENLMGKFNRIYDSKVAELMRLDDESRAESLRDIVRSIINL